jgi:hypothetical protein
MSWEAVTWAMKQKLKKSNEQIVLLVLANCADPDGEAFSKWNYREHWWRYLSDHTRLPRSSLFRHLNTLIALGLCSKSLLVLADGARRPTVRLDFEAAFDISKEADQERYEAATSHKSDDESQGETQESADEEVHEIDNDINEVDDCGQIAPDESHPETGESHSHPREYPFPIVGMHKKDSNNSIDSSLPSSGGTHASDDLWNEFVRSWSDPIQLMTQTRAAWDRVPTGRRPKLIAAAKGFWTYRRGLTKPKEPQSARSFIRDEIGWDQWLRYLPAHGVGPPSVSGSFPLASREGRAITTLYELAGCRDALHKIMIRNGAVSYRNPITPRLLALASVSSRDDWVPLTHQQACAWEAWFREVVTVQTRRALKAGDRAPWAWPPRVDGTLSPATGPPEVLITDQDITDFTG